MQAAGDMVGQVVVHLPVHCGANRFVDAEFGQRTLFESQILHGGVERPLMLCQLIQHSEEDLRTRWPLAVLIDPPMLYRLDVFAFLHLARQPLFVGPGKEIDLADLAQVHADRVIHAVLRLELGVLLFSG